MKKLVSIILAIVMVLSIPLNVTANDNLNSEESIRLIESGYGKATKLFEIPYGDSEENLSRTDIREDSEILLPKSFCINSDGDFYILDTLSNKVKVYTSTGDFLKSINLPSEIYGLDIEKVDNYLFVYSDNCNLYLIDEDNTEVIEVVTNIEREDIAGIYSVENELFVRSYNGMDKKITVAVEQNKNLKNASSIFTLEDDDTVIGLSQNDGVEKLSLDEEITYNLSCVLEPAGAYCIKKEKDVTYLLSNETDWTYVETRISKVSDNTYESALTISGKEYHYGNMFKKIYIHDGVVYQAVPERNAFSIYLIPWTMEYETRITDEMVYKYNQTDDNLLNIASNTTVAAKVSVTRDEAMDRAIDMCYTSWKYNPNTMFTPTGDYTQSPQQLSSTAKTVAGIPYCWGGMHGLDTATYSGSNAGYLQNFSDCLTSGKTAGNINTKSKEWVNTTFGMDCSGFVCAAFKIGTKVRTSDLDDYFTLSSWENVQVGDVAIRSGHHTFIISYVYTSETSGFYMVGTYESTIDGDSACTKSYKRYYDDCMNYNLYTY